MESFMMAEQERTDVVERLRRITADDLAVDTCLEAATEIVRLRTQCETLKARLNAAERHIEALEKEGGTE